MQALIEAHDLIAEQYLEGGKSKSEAPWEEITMREESKRGGVVTEEIDESNVIYGQPIRVIGLRKSLGQPLVRIFTHSHIFHDFSSRF